MRKMSSYEAPWGKGAELFIIRTGEWRYQRPVFSGDKCCQCGSCYLFCPVGCIGDKGKYYAANGDYCKGCGICASVCSANAIKMVREDGS